MRGTGNGVLAAVSTALALLVVVPPAPPEEGDGVVRAVLFASPTCPHCRTVRRALPGLVGRFGARVQIAVLSTATPEGYDLYQSAIQRYAVLRRGVPLLVVGQYALVGSQEIPERLPGLVESYLDQGGADWPPLPGLEAALSAMGPAPAQMAVAPTPPPPTPLPAPQPPPAASLAPVVTAPPAPPTPRPTPESPVAAPPTTASAAASQPLPESTAAPSEPVATPAIPAGLLVLEGDGAPRGWLDRLRADPRGNGLAVLVLVGMAAVLLRSAVALRAGGRATRGTGLDWLNPLLALLGLGVAAYLASVEVREVEAVCGPVGDCNTVQQSEYARLFGVLPIGVLGVLGFALILAAWGVRRYANTRAASWAAITLLALTGFGTLFSVYLTFLEPFVIGATCLWCLSSAVIMTTLYALAQSPGRQAAERLGLCPPGDSP